MDVLFYIFFWVSLRMSGNILLFLEESSGHLSRISYLCRPVKLHTWFWFFVTNHISNNSCIFNNNSFIIGLSFNLYWVGGDGLLQS